MTSQHTSLSDERWSEFALDQQILMIANEMNRAKKMLDSNDAVRFRNCLERVLTLTDLTIRVQSKPTLRRELLRWRDLIAELYLCTYRCLPDATHYRAAFKALLLFTPEAAKQRSYVLS